MNKFTDKIQKPELIICLSELNDLTYLIPVIFQFLQLSSSLVVAARALKNRVYLKVSTSREDAALYFAVVSARFQVCIT